jgi:hypothetical protein
MKRLFLVLAGLVLLSGAVALTAAEKPASIIHVVTLRYKDGTTDEQKKAVLAGIEKMSREIPGIARLWLKSTKVQGGYLVKQPNGESKTVPMTDAFVMEFKDEAAFKAYADHPAHKEWEKTYIQVRDRSATSDITN